MSTRLAEISTVERLHNSLARDLWDNGGSTETAPRQRANAVDPRGLTDQNYEGVIG